VGRKQQQQQQQQQQRGVEKLEQAMNTSQELWFVGGFIMNRNKQQ
jgi:hypothetical protein